MEENTPVFGLKSGNFLVLGKQQTFYRGKKKGFQIKTAQNEIHVKAELENSRVHRAAKSLYVRASDKTPSPHTSLPPRTQSKQGQSSGTPARKGPGCLRAANHHPAPGVPAWLLLTSPDPTCACLACQGSFHCPPRRAWLPPPTPPPRWPRQSPHPGPAEVFTPGPGGPGLAPHCLELPVEETMGPSSLPAPQASSVPGVLPPQGDPQTLTVWLVETSHRTDAPGSDMVWERGGWQGPRGPRGGHRQRPGAQEPLPDTPRGRAARPPSTPWGQLPLGTARPRDGGTHHPPTGISALLRD